MELSTGLLLVHHQIQHRVGQREQVGVTPTPWGFLDLACILLKNSSTNQVPSVWLSGRSDKPDQPPGSLCAPPLVGQNCDPGGREPALPPMPQIGHVRCTKVHQRPSSLNISVPIGRVAETPLTAVRGSDGRNSNDAHRLRFPPSDCYHLQIPRQDPVGMG